MSEITTREERNILRSFERFSAVPTYRNPPNTIVATQAKPRFVVRPMRADSNGYPLTDDLWAVVELSQRDKYIRNSSRLTANERASLYTEWFKMCPSAFALLERIPADNNDASIIGNTAILPIKCESMERVAAGAVKVIDLTASDLATTSEDRVLLFDTWVLHADYKQGQCEDSLFSGKFQSCTHHRFGNVLALKHLGTFWEPGNKLKLYVEPSAKSMDRLMMRLGFGPAAKSKEMKRLLLLDYDPKAPLTRHNALRHKLTEDVMVALKSYKTWWSEEWTSAQMIN